MTNPDPSSLQPERIIFLPPNHEQSWPSFHVEEELLSSLLAHLKTHQIELTQEPELLGHLGPEAHNLYEVKVSDDHSEDELEDVLSSFLDSLDLAKS
jgi:hypothetical protein